MTQLRLLLFALLAGFIAANAYAGDEKPFVPPNRWALVIGAGAYQNFKPLKYATKDARAFSEALVKDYQFDTENIRLLTDDAPKELGKPTVKNIRQELDRLLLDKRLDKADLFIFYFAGHGQGLPSGDFLLPTNIAKADLERDGLPVKALVDQIVKAGLKNVLIVADACREGEKNEFGAELQALGKKANIAVLLGCAPGTRSYEYADLKHGVFTYQLLRSLGKPELRDPTSGALWASNVALDVSNEVYAYTERDFGDSAQKPAIWTEKTQDVLLGAYIPEKLASGAVKAFTDTASKLDRKLYVSALANYAYELYDTQHLLEAVEVLKTLDQLSEMTQYPRYVLAQALDDTGRLSEASKVFDLLAQDSEESALKYMSIVLNPSRTLPVSKRFEAAQKLWKLNRSWVTGQLVWMTYRSYPGKVDREAFLGELLGTAHDGRRQAYVRAERFLVQGKWQLALQQYELASQTFGLVPSDGDLAGFMFPLLAKLGRPEAMDAIIARRLKDPNATGSWHLIAAQFAKTRGKNAAALTHVQNALRHDLSPDSLLLALKISGIHMDRVAKQVIEQADRYPYAWKALLAKTIAQTVSGGDPAIALEAEAYKYADDPVAYMSLAYPIVLNRLTEGVAAGVVAPEILSTFRSSYAGVLTLNAQAFGQDPEVWALLSELGLQDERQPQIARLFDTYLGPHLRAGTLLPELAPVYAIAALSAGDFKTAEKIFTTASFSPADSIDVQWEYAGLLACQGRFAEAAKAIRGVTKPSPELQEEATGLQAYIAANTGDKKGAAKTLAGYSPSGPAAMQYKAMALASLGNWKSAMPLLEKVKLQYSWVRFYVWAAAYRTYSDRMKALKKEASLTDELYAIAVTAGDNPLFAKVGFANPPKASAFEGTTVFDGGGIGNDLGTRAPGIITLKLNQKGVGTFTFDLQESAPMVIPCKVDGYGNLSGQIRWNGQLHDLMGKVATSKIYQTYPLFSTRGQAFTLLSEKGVRYVFVGKVAKP